MWKGNPGTAYAGNFAFGHDVNNPLDTGYGYSNAIAGVFDTYTESQKRTGAISANPHTKSCAGFVQGKQETHLRVGSALYNAASVAPAAKYHGRLRPTAWSTAQESVLYTPGINSAGVRVCGQSNYGAQLPQVYVGAIVPEWAIPQTEC